jgi:hypothetical protein
VKTAWGTIVAHGDGVRSVLSLCLLAAGCFSGEPTTLEHIDTPMLLADMPGLNLWFHGSLGDELWDPGSQGVSAQVNYRKSDLVDEEDGTAACATLDDSFTATIGGMPITSFDRGGWPFEFPDESCSVPSVWLSSIPAELRRPGVQLVLTDSSRSITADMGEWFVKRTAEPIGAPDWHFRPGETVTLRWSPAIDLTTASPSVRFLGPTDPPAGHVEFTITDRADFTRTEDTIAFTLPNRELEGRMIIGFGSSPTIECGDIDCTSYGGQRVYRDDVVIAP